MPGRGSCVSIAIQDELRSRPPIRGCPPGARGRRCLLVRRDVVAEVLVAETLDRAVLVSGNDGCIKLGFERGIALAESDSASFSEQPPLKTRACHDDVGISGFCLER